MNPTNSTPTPYWTKKSLSFLVWLSPAFTYSFFLPLGVLFLYPRTFSLRAKALLLIATYFVCIGLFFPLELFIHYSLENEMQINFFLNDSAVKNGIIGIFVLCVGILLFANYVLSSLRHSKRKVKREAHYALLFPEKKLRNQNQIRDSRLDHFFLVFFLSLFLSFAFQALGEFISPPNPRNPTVLLKSLQGFLFNYLLSVQILLLSLNRNKLPSLYARVLLRYQNGIRLKETWRQKYLNREKIPFLKELEVKKAASFREAILPGYGHIYLEDFWRGFPILFISLLLWLFIAVWSFSYLSPIFGIQFLSSMGLKPGISDKDFFVSSQNIMYLAISILAFIFIYLYSRHLLSQSFTLQNLGYKKAQSDDEKEPVFASGVRKGFRNILPLSLLFHFILLCLVFIIPISLQRNSAKKKEKSDQASHFQPEKMEFYFIDPNVPDTTKGLNGGVYTGNETKTENGEKISDKKLSDNGPKSGYIKKIRGKKVPPTYSNYISAKMRVPESYLEYWSKAPQPYSSVVAYTITKDGDIIDVELVEGSNYPDQDRLTLELVERMGPLMPPPESEGLIRVTELFWNGPVDPNYVPTPLQKEMVYMFDGRYMEEIDE